MHAHASGAAILLVGKLIGGWTLYSGSAADKDDPRAANRFFLTCLLSDVPAGCLPAFRLLPSERAGTRPSQRKIHG